MCFQPSLESKFQHSARAGRDKKSGDPGSSLCSTLPICDLEQSLAPLIFRLFLFEKDDAQPLQSSALCLPEIFNCLVSFPLALHFIEPSLANQVIWSNHPPGSLWSPVNCWPFSPLCRSGWRIRRGTPPPADKLAESKQWPRPGEETGRSQTREPVPPSNPLPHRHHCPQLLLVLLMGIRK